MTLLNDLIASFRIFYSNFNAAYGRLINTVLLCLMLFVLAVVAVRTLRLNRRIRRTEVGLEMPQSPRQQAWCQALSQAIQIPTVTGDTAQMEALYQWLQTQFPTVFSSLETTRLPSGAVLLRWRGTATGGQKPVLLCAHMDVVPVEGQAWSADPFSGKIDEEFVHGRGALDCKNVLIGLLCAVEDLRQEGFRPSRDLYFAFGCDEETGGEQGAKAIAAELRRQGLSFEFILDEGSNITTEHLGNKNFPAALVGVAEKGAATYQLTVHTKGGHAAMPPAHTAVGILAEAVCRLEAAPMHKRLLPVMRQCLDFSAPALGLAGRICVANLPFTRPLLYHFTRHNDQLSSLLHTTLAVTQCSGAPTANVLPETAQATINARLLQGDSGQSVLEYIQALLADLPVTVEMVSCVEPSAITESMGPIYQTITSTVGEVFGRLPCIPTIMPAGTDTKHYGEFSSHIFRFLPFPCDPQTFSTIHGADERIRCQSFGAGVAFYEALMRKL